MSDTVEREEVGNSIQCRLLGDRMADSVRSSVAQKQFGYYALEHSRGSCFGDIWGRPGLDMRSRSVATLAGLIALGATDQIKIHVGIAIRNGLTLVELEELLYHMIPYVGYPSVITAIAASKHVLQHLGLILAQEPAV